MKITRRDFLKSLGLMAAGLAALYLDHLLKILPRAPRAAGRPARFFRSPDDLAG